MESSIVTRAPLVFIGFFSICTRMSWPFESMLRDLLAAARGRAQAGDDHVAHLQEPVLGGAEVDERGVDGGQDVVDLGLVDVAGDGAGAAPLDVGLDGASLLEHGHSQLREVDRDQDGLGGICDYCHVGAPTGASRSTMSVRTSRMMVGVAPMVAATAVATSSGRAVPASVRSMSATSPSRAVADTGAERAHVDALVRLLGCGAGHDRRVGGQVALDRLIPVEVVGDLDQIRHAAHARRGRLADEPARPRSARTRPAAALTAAGRAPPWWVRWSARRLPAPPHSAPPLPGAAPARLPAGAAWRARGRPDSRRGGAPTGVCQPFRGATENALCRGPRR